MTQVIAFNETSWADAEWPLGSHPSADGVTFWAKHDKPMKDLGYSPRPLDEGLREPFQAEGKL